jgi:hypothetical protein
MVENNPKNTPAGIRDQGDFAELVGEGLQEFLGVVGGAEIPFAAGAECYG